MKWFVVIVATSFSAAAWSGCAPESSSEPADGVFDELGAPFPSATPDERAAFERGREVALRRFTPEDGLGPELNVASCGACHEKPVLGGSASHYRDFLLVADELAPDVVVLRGKNGVQRHFSLEHGRAPSDPLTNLGAIRNPIPFFGAGLLQEIPDAEIMSRADPEDADGDGISGRPNFDGVLVGRFGRKAQTARLELFLRGPLFNHLGITTDPLSAEKRAALPSFDATIAADVFAPTGEVGVIVAAQAVIPDEPTVDLDAVPDPELSESDLFDLLCFTLLLAAPEPEPQTPESARGKRTFEDIGCAKCHVPAVRGPRGEIPAYSDLLLHDMGPDLADAFPMGEARGNEFRTQPLWGVVAAAPYLHDGRAGTLDEAIRWHGGEAASIRDAYSALSDVERQELLSFLESLGGRVQRTDGLIAPTAEIPAPGTYGGPLVGLDSEQLEAFERGRLLFDRDFTISEGVGPLFNGDACRSCHFDPVVGGAGPSDVDVMRQGALEGESFIMPSGGTALPRHAVSPARPEPSDEANFFERRQTPTTLGLGLLERIPRGTIEALADPDDVDGDGIRGRVHRLDDGRIGRFGWKADVASIREFVRDALSTELGMTVPEDPSSATGVTDDGDQRRDPEVDSVAIDAMTDFIASLAPPPRMHADQALEDRGETVFAEVGCGQCHVAILQTGDGVDVHAYTDLLLHDVAEPGAFGIEAGEAGIRDFRTAPLWGLGRSAPYLHDGRASTIEDAVRAHAGEAAAAQARFAALSPADRLAVLAFLASL